MNIKYIYRLYKCNKIIFLSITCWSYMDYMFPFLCFMMFFFLLNILYFFCFHDLHPTGQIFKLIQNYDITIMRLTVNKENNVNHAIYWLISIWNLPWYWALNPLWRWLLSVVKCSRNQFLLLTMGTGILIPDNLRERRRPIKPLLLRIKVF